MVPGQGQVGNPPDPGDSVRTAFRPHRWDGSKGDAMTKVAAVLAAVEKAKADGSSYLAVSKNGLWVVTKVA